MRKIIELEPSFHGGSAQLGIAYLKQRRYERDKDAAIRELMTAYDERENDIYWMKVDPRLDPLGTDPRFHQLLEKVRFPQ